MDSFFRVLTAVALILAMGMGMGSVAAQETATSNETQVEWPTATENVSVQDARDALEEQPDELPRESVTAIINWLSDRDNLEELGASERDRLSGWLVDARSLEADLPEVPDLNQPETGDDRDDQESSDGENASSTEDELVEELNGTAVDTLANQETIRFNNDSRIVGWEFGDGSVKVAIHTDRRAGVTVTDALAGMGEAGATQVPETSKFLERDEVTVVQMDVENINNAQAVGVEVDGMTVRLNTEMGDDNPLHYFGGQSGLFAGMGITIVMAGSAAVFVVWREESGVIEA